MKEQVSESLQSHCMLGEDTGAKARENRGGRGYGTRERPEEREERVLKGQEAEEIEVNYATMLHISQSKKGFKKGWKARMAN